MIRDRETAVWFVTLILVNSIRIDVSKLYGCPALSKWKAQNELMGKTCEGTTPPAAC